MTRHAKPTRMLRPLNKRQWVKIAAVVAAAGLLGAAGLVSRSFYHADDVKPISTILRSPPPIRPHPVLPLVAQSTAPTRTPRSLR